MSVPPVQNLPSCDESKGFWDLLDLKKMIDEESLPETIPAEWDYIEPATKKRKFSDHLDSSDGRNQSVFTFEYVDYPYKVVANDCPELPIRIAISKGEKTYVYKCTEIVEFEKS
ncbi:hypothetical protein HNY73_001057 [Argiope bruennichi]|uniref:Uncharacterized protein n=1 Tax=Argiope bruennichi TaxID=94029 RepID=A0A8T0G0C1_ARGBR|nr:hypothetical protein HNY73_001057 [Argiope bruennichi]